MIPYEPATLPLKFESYPSRRAVKFPDPRVVYGVELFPIYTGCGSMPT